MHIGGDVTNKVYSKEYLNRLFTYREKYFSKYLDKELGEPGLYDTTADQAKYDRGPIVSVLYFSKIIIDGYFKNVGLGEKRLLNSIKLRLKNLNIFSFDDFSNKFDKVPTDIEQATYRGVLRFRMEELEDLVGYYKKSCLHGLTLTVFKGQDNVAKILCHRALLLPGFMLRGSRYDFEVADRYYKEAVYQDYMNLIIELQNGGFRLFGYHIDVKHSVADIKNTCFSGLRLENERFEHCIFEKCDFANVVMHNMTFVGCKFNRSRFYNVKMQDCKFVRCTFYDAVVTKVTAFNCKFYECDEHMATGGFGDEIFVLEKFVLKGDDCHSENCSIGFFKNKYTHDLDLVKALARAYREPYTKDDIEKLIAIANEYSSVLDINFVCAFCYRDAREDLSGRMLVPVSWKFPEVPDSKNIRYRHIGLFDDGCLDAWARQELSLKQPEESDAVTRWIYPGIDLETFKVWWKSRLLNIGEVTKEDIKRFNRRKNRYLEVSHHE